MVGKPSSKGKAARGIRVATTMKRGEATKREGLGLWGGVFHTSIMLQNSGLFHGSRGRGQKKEGKGETIEKKDGNRGEKKHCVDLAKRRRGKAERANAEVWWIHADGTKGLDKGGHGNTRPYQWRDTTNEFRLATRVYEI